MPVLTASGGCKELYLSTSLDALNQKAEVKVEKQINVQRFCLEGGVALPHLADIVNNSHIFIPSIYTTYK